MSVSNQTSSLLFLFGLNSNYMEGVSLGRFNKVNLSTIPIENHYHLSDESDQNSSTNATYLHILHLSPLSN